MAGLLGDDTKDRLREIAGNLLTLEVNTIVKPGMTARKMPPVPIAVLDIIVSYYWFLLGINKTLHDSSVAEQLDKVGGDKRTNGLETLQAIRSCAEILRNRGYADNRPEETRSIKSDRIVVIDRIYRTAQMLEPISTTLSADKPENWGKARADLLQPSVLAACRAQQVEPKDLAVIRKAWEVGVETVVMQSAIQIDGDIVTRIQSEYQDGSHKALHGLHLEACRMSIETWKTMAELVGSFLGGIGKWFASLLGRR